MSRVHLACFAALIATGSASCLCAPVPGASAGSVSGLVRDSAGVPQIGALVELLRPDLTVIASVYTEGNGRFSIPAVVPGRYSVKAMGASYLPSLRENVRVRTNTVINLTLNTLYEVMQWLPAEPRAVNAQKDDWAWTLRSAANRPLLRWLEDGPLVVVSDGSGTAPKLKARLMATGQEGTFGESGERFSAAVEETPSNSRELLARVDFAPDTDAGMESMLGFRQDLGFAGSVQSVAAVAIHPDVDGSGSGGEGLDEAAIRSWETMHLGDELDAEAGSTQVVARFADHVSNTPSTNTVLAALPFASVGWRDGGSIVSYRMTTFVPGSQDADDTEARAWLPEVSSRNGKLALEHGFHQEIGWERRTDVSDMAVMIFADKVDNPAIEAMGHFAAEDPSVEGALFDRASGLMRAAGQNFSTTGMTATMQRKLPGGNFVRVSYANGGALVLPVQSTTGAIDLEQALGAAHPRRAQMYTLSLSGTVDGTGTRWRASYRWQPEDTVTRVAPYAADAVEPYLNLHIRQPIHLRHDAAGGFEALLDVRNLLAQGYRPYLMSDGSLIVFAQDQRGITGGLAFTF